MRAPGGQSTEVVLDRPRTNVTLEVGGVIRLIGPECLPAWSGMPTPVVLKASSDRRRYVAVTPGSIDVVVYGRSPVPEASGENRLKEYTHLLVTVID